MVQVLVQAREGYFAGGNSSITDIDFVTISSTGNATDFGNFKKALKQYHICWWCLKWN